MRRIGRKVVAVLTLAVVAVMLWLERDHLAGGGFFWLLIGLLAAVLAVFELLSVGESRAAKKTDTNSNQEPRL